ncbi:MAG: hypothetical protein OEV92_06810 [Nitrospinota bacterium]|nr:hypothetical protein [Nitrospinota bacterium]
MSEIGGVVKDMAEAIDKLYQGFLLRDFFSFVMPGATVIYFAMRPDWPWSDLKSLLTDIGGLPGWIAWVLFFLALGTCYIAGLAIQCIFADALTCPWGKFDKNRDLALIRFFSGKYNTVKEFHLNMLELHHRNDEGSKYAQKVHERNIILKQMTGNMAGAMVISATILLLRFITIPQTWIVFILFIILTVGLIAGHKALCVRQDIWLKAALDTKSAADNEAARPQAQK